MRRRSFVKSAIALSAAAVLPGCGRSNPGPSTSSTLAAVRSNGDPTTLQFAEVREFADELHGKLYLPTDDGYNVVRKVWNGMIDKRPALIAQCSSVTDVQNAVTFARDHELLVAVRGGGHSYPGKSTCDGGLMIDLSQLHAVEIDPDARTATVAGGALLGHLDTASLNHGLATTTGIVSHTGVGGFTLGGGMGRLDRVHGLAVDNLLAATVVTADGQIVHARDDENADLLWALRGGGGNFGVVTEFVFRLHPFAGTVYGGFLEYPMEQATAMMSRLAELEPSLPDAASIEPYLYVNEGERIFGITALYMGDAATGESVLAPVVDMAKPVFNSLDTGSYSAWQTMLDGDLGHGKLNYLKSGFITELTPEFIEAFVGNFDAEILPGVWFQHLGGATSRIDEDSAAFAHRNVGFNLGMDAVFTDPAETEGRVAAVRNYYNAMAPFMKGYYTNLNEEGARKTKGNYGPSYTRLAETKAKFDPGNLFRLNANIEPAA